MSMIRKVSYGLAITNIKAQIKMTYEETNRVHRFAYGQTTFFVASMLTIHWPWLITLFLIYGIPSLQSNLLIIYFSTLIISIIATIIVDKRYVKIVFPYALYERKIISLYHRLTENKKNKIIHRTGWFTVLHLFLFTCELFLTVYIGLNLY